MVAGTFAISEICAEDEVDEGETGAALIASGVGALAGAAELPEACATDGAASRE